MTVKPETITPDMFNTTYRVRSRLFAANNVGIVEGMIFNLTFVDDTAPAPAQSPAPTP